jgi:acyl dehydratase
MGSTELNLTVGASLPPLEVKVLARHVVMGASSSRDWQPQHHDTHWAVERVKVKDIFLNTPNQAGWFERYLTDWTGPSGRLAKVRFKMKKSVCAGDTMRFEGTVAEIDDGFVDVDVVLSVDGDVATECRARIAVPRNETDDPWQRTGDDWRP